jgi:hypothetical protein
MYPPALSLAFALLLALSLGIKAHIGNGAVTTVQSDDKDIAQLLSSNGFAIRHEQANADPVWIYGTKQGCNLQIADVSTQGWHRRIVEWQAQGRLLLYSVGGHLYEEQPILMPMMAHYLGRLERYVGIDAAPVRARAIVIDDRCPAVPIPLADLEALS